MGAEKRARDHVTHTRVLARIELFMAFSFLSHKAPTGSLLLFHRAWTIHTIWTLSYHLGCRSGTDSFSECQNKRNMRGVIALHQLTQSQTSIIVCNELKLCQKPKAAKVRKISLRKYANIFSLRDGWNIGILFGKKQSHTQHENLP